MKMFRNERKPSHFKETPSTILPAVDFTGDEDNDSVSVDWVYTTWARWTTRILSMLSLVSVSANTPHTFKLFPWLFFFTFVIDVIVLIYFAFEMIAKIRIKGAIKANPKMLLKAQIPGLSGGLKDLPPKAYFRRSWGIFDGLMVFFLFVSVVLSCYELTIFIRFCDITALNNFKMCQDMTSHYKKNGYLSILRCPRPLILIRVFRSILKSQVPQSRIEAIFHRSTHQVYNVTVFLLFFMSLYGILGVQFFGSDLNYHCVLKTANESEITMDDLAIPDSYCNPKGVSDYSCPTNMKCVLLKSDTSDEGNYASFDAFHVSFFTVYQAASQEGWVFIMYRAMDCLPPWKGVVYFLSMIFFLAWLVKNVFIAVLIETFAEIRVQFQQMWTRRSAADTDSSMSDGNSWKLVPVNESKPRGLAPRFFQETVLKSTAFNVILMLLVLANALTATGLHFNHEQTDDEGNYDFSGSNKPNKIDAFYYTEVVFTMLFNLEAIFKVWCLGWKSYWHRSLHKYEFVLCIGTTLHCIKKFYRTQFTYFQVLRIARLIKASPMLEDFCFKIFGPGKKLGSLIMFTMCLLVITSSFSLQLFCYIKEFDSEFQRFSNFPNAFMQIFTFMTAEAWTEVVTDTMNYVGQMTPNPVAHGIAVFLVCVYLVLLHLFFESAFMSMFQILTQKGWVAVMHGTMNAVKNETVAWLVAIYFVFYHLFVTLIVLSLFVAVILDNLELDEDIKKLKQLKLREISAETQQKLPMRLRIFEKFPNRPQMIKLTRILSDFLLPRIRDSFMRQFALIGPEDMEEELELRALGASKGILTGNILNKVRGLKGEEKREAIIYLINESNKTRMMSIEQPTVGPARSLLSTQHQIRMERRLMLKKWVKIKKKNELEIFIKQ